MLNKIIIGCLLYITSSFALSVEQTIHLLNRTSFGYSKNDLYKYSKFTKEEAIQYLINSTKSTQIYNLPKNIENINFPKKGEKRSFKEKKIVRQTRKKELKQLQIWWLNMMIDSRFSFREKMTLFWHNHLVSSYKVVKIPYFMYLQNKLYREEALGHFDNLIHRSSKDLAMLIYLDSNSNKKSHPNENYGRELLELFTLGEGSYTETDVKEAAKAFTGWRVNRKKRKFVKNNKLHDFGKKHFLGQSGNFDGEDIINIVLQQDKTSQFIITKLYKKFISLDINENLVNKIAKDFKNSSYDISLAMRQLLLSDDFWNQRNNLIKSPVELIVSLAKVTGVDFKNQTKIENHFIFRSLKDLQQDLFNPPSVKGWKGGKSWINTSSIVLRTSLINSFIHKKLDKQKRKSVNIKVLRNTKFQLK